MDQIWKFIVSIAILYISHLYWKHRRYRDKADKFKEILVKDLPNFISDKTTISAVVLSFFPSHNEEFHKLLIYVPKSKGKILRATWSKYKEVYDSYRSLGVFGAVGAELPHPDFEPSLENVRAVERKRKKQIAEALNEFIEKL